MVHGVLSANPSRDMHHIVRIADDASKRMERSNWLALCRVCHEYIEGDVIEGMRVKQWSDANYEVLVGD